MEHHVYFWLHDEHKNAGDRAAFEAALESLLAIPAVGSGRWGLPAAVKERPNVDQSWDYALSITFSDLAGHDAYQIDENHLRFIDAYKPWWAKVRISDLI